MAPSSDSEPAAPWPWPAPADDGAAGHLGAGCAVPAIALLSTNGAPVDLSAVAGLSIVFIYPWTGRPGHPNPPDWDAIPGAHGSTPEAEGFRDLNASFRDAGYHVFGLSNQSAGDQREFSDRLGLPYPILSDAAGHMSAALALPSFEMGVMRYLKRLTLVLRDGLIERVIYPVHPPHTHARDVLDVLCKGRR